MYQRRRQTIRFGPRLLHPFILFDAMDALALKKVGRFVVAMGTVLVISAGAISLLI